MMSQGCPHSPWPTTSLRSLSHPPRATSTAGADGGSWLPTPLKWKGHGGRKRGGGPPDKVSGAPAALLGAGQKPEATQGRSRSAKARRRLLGGSTHGSVMPPEEPLHEDRAGEHGSEASGPAELCQATSEAPLGTGRVSPPPQPPP